MNSDPDFAAASAGIISPHQVCLTPGMWICRFAASTDPDGKATDPSALHRAPWWMSSDDFRKLLFATQNSKFNYKFYARLWLAVKSEWSAMDRLIIARVRAPLAAWAGRGRTMRDQMPNGMTFVYQTPKDLTQLYIPGLTVRAGDSNSGYNLSKIAVDSVNEVPPIGVAALD